MKDFPICIDIWHGAFLGQQHSKFK